MRLVKTIAAIGAVALLVPAAGLAQQAAQAPQGPPPVARGRGGDRAAAAAPRQNLQLTEQQREQLRAFDEQQRTAAETTRRELGDLHRQLEEELTAAQPNSGRVNQLRGSIVQKETALSQHRLDRMTKLSSLLSAEQRQGLRGRGLGSILRGGGGIAPPRRGAEFARGPQPRGGRGPMMQRRGQIQDRRFEAERRMQMQRGLRGRGGVGPAFGPRSDGDLRQQMRRLEAELEALRRRIGRE